MPSPDTHPQFQPASRAEWRQWLAEHHANAAGVWLVYCKKASGLPSLSYAEAVEEALCFGWIDSHPASSTPTGRSSSTRRAGPKAVGAR